jgi:hypothetical protein
MKKRVKCKTSEEKGEFGSPWNEFLKFKCGTSIMLGLDNVIHLLVLYLIRGSSSDLGC